MTKLQKFEVTCLFTDNEKLTLIVYTEDDINELAVIDDDIKYFRTGLTTGSLVNTRTVKTIDLTHLGEIDLKVLTDEYF